MAEAITFPRILYHATEPTGRIFESQEALDAAGPGWVQAPTEVQAPPTPPQTGPQESPPSEGESHTPPRSRR